VTIDPARARRRASVRPGAVFVWTLGGPVAGLIVIGVLVALLTGDTSVTTIVAPLAAMSSVLVGALLVTRLPRHRIGWLLWTSGMLLALTRITQGLADQGLTRAPGSVPGAIWFGWAEAWIGPLGVVILPIFLPLLYPTGNLPSGRWRLMASVAMAGVAGDAAVAAVSPFAPGTYPPGVVNPLALGGGAGDLVAGLGNLLNPLLFAGLVLALVALVRRYGRATGIEREQLKWFLFVALIAIVALVVAAFLVDSTTDPLATIDTIAWFTGFTGFALMPVAIGIAVLRYRLYEIDRLISRSISWAIVSIIVGGLFTGFILLFQAVLAPITRSNDFAVAGSTLLVATLFQRIRLPVQRLVDRHFNRSRYDIPETVGAYASRLRDQVDLDQLRAEIAATVATTVEPASVGLWLRD